VNSRHAPSSPAIDREPSSVAAGPSQAPPYTRAPLGPSAQRRRWRTRACGACWRLLGPATRFLPSWNLVGIRSYCGVTRACVVPAYMRPCVCACVRASACCLYVRDCVGAWLRAFRACVPACPRACVPAMEQSMQSGGHAVCRGVSRAGGWCEVQDLQRRAHSFPVRTAFVARAWAWPCAEKRVWASYSAAPGQYSSIDAVRLKLEQSGLGIALATLSISW
jgi:hypothetical protein